MAGLTGKTIGNTYKDLLTTGNSGDGLSSTLVPIIDGAGESSAIKLSTTTLQIPSGKTLDVQGTLSAVASSLTGNLSAESIRLEILQ